ncbi:MAG: 2,3,4,5-tetrahydropyridine-2,6-dicarboxylate N-succinyltransferase [Proteobacteria bacterium]|nr:2,3,4,5-tetrahydropyridine-2,6-dicarboxylate N-succinyltransferase [Pseudomonadota bacterium]
MQSHLDSGDSNFLTQNKQTVEKVIDLLDVGAIRVCEKSGSDWLTNVWIKQAVLMYFRVMDTVDMEVGPFVYRDKIPLKKNFKSLGVRVVPPAVARYGTFMENGVIMMPSYVNIGAWIGSGTMVDTWATVGSCAQIGANVHLSGGVGIGGVLEPAQASPVIVEDGAFLGSRSIVVEGVRIGEQAVLGANVTLTSGTPIVDLRSDQRNIIKGFVPPRCVVVPGTLEKDAPGGGGKIHTQCAYIIGERKASTDLKTSLNSALREYDVSV